MTVAPPMYLTVAYRWGNENGHQYFVYCGPDKTKAIQLARLECDDRGGKYGVAVFEFDAEGIDYAVVFYAPSMQENDDADRPRYNHALDYFERLGLFLDGACRTGFIYEPVPGDIEGIMGHKARQVAVPQFMIDEHARQCEALATWERIEREQQQLKDEQPPKDTPCRTSPTSPVPNANTPSP